MVSRRRFEEWIAALEEERRTAGRLPWLTFARAILGGTVPARVWRRRMRTCLTCPMFRRELNLCKSVHPQFLGLGCHCVTWMIALFSNPEGNGCFAKTRNPASVLGWGPYRMPWWERLWSPVRFLLRR